MINLKKFIGTILVSTCMVTTSITAYASVSNQSLSNNNSSASYMSSDTPSSPEIVFGKDTKSGTSQIGGPQENVEDGSIIKSSVVIESIPIGDMETSELRLDPDEWWNPIDGGNQIRGYSSQSIWAINPYQAKDIPLNKVRHSIKNQLWISNSLVTSSPTLSKYGLTADVSSPWAKNRKVGEACRVNGSHSVFDETLGIPGRQIISRPTEAVGTIPKS